MATFTMVGSYQCDDSDARRSNNIEMLGDILADNQRMKVRWVYEQDYCKDVQQRLKMLEGVTNVQVSMLNVSASIGLESQNGGLPHSGYSIYTKLHYLVVTNNK